LNLLINEITTSTWVAELRKKKLKEKNKKKQRPTTEPRELPSNPKGQKKEKSSAPSIS
jgi:hypothetical protein